jgi:hypothetical protein
MWATCPLSVSSGYHAEFHEGCYQKHTNPLNCRTSCSDISGYHTDFHEGHGTVGQWQGRGIACVNKRGTVWQRNGMGTAWGRHGMCELSLSKLTVNGLGWNSSQAADNQLKIITSTICHIYTFYLLMMGC